MKNIKLRIFNFFNNINLSDPRLNFTLKYNLNSLPFGKIKLVRKARPNLKLTFNDLEDITEMRNYENFVTSKCFII